MAITAGDESCFPQAEGGMKYKAALPNLEQRDGSHLWIAPEDDQLKAEKPPKDTENNGSAICCCSPPGQRSLLLADSFLEGKSIYIYEV